MIWATSDTAVATVSSSGLVTSVGDGTATLTVTSGSASAAAAVTVQVTTSIELSDTTLSFSTLGDTTQLSATVKDAGGSTISGATVIWATSDTAVATVSDAGLITSVANGTASVTATSGVVSDTATATVSQVTASIELSHTSIAIWSLGSTTQITATVRDANSRTIVSPAPTVSWATSNPTVATISGDGLVTSLTAGSTTITAISSTMSDAASVVVAECTVDTDGDRLPDCAETGTGIFLNQLNAGTQPNNTDTDGDGISDGDEVLGTIAGLDLPGLGVSPVVPSILIEYDWFDDAVGSDGPAARGRVSGHTHRPTTTQIDLVTASFAAQGIEVIHDYGQGSAPFNGGNLISDADGNVDGMGTEYYTYKAAHFDDNRNSYFHYSINPHQYNNGNSSGLAEVNGDDFIVATGGWSSNNLAVAGTIQHELGHNLGLRHGGKGININRKPNYNSVMNYNYQFYGVDNDCTPVPDGVLDYSRGVNPDLDENNLDETQGICGGSPGWDWNEDGDSVDTGVIADINRRWRASSSGDGDDLFGVLTDYNDWDNLNYAGIFNADGGPFFMLVLASREMAICQPFPDSLLTKH